MAHKPNGHEVATPEFFWTIALLKQVARYPHRNSTWLSHGHTVENTERPNSLDPGNRFAGVLLMKPQWLPKGVENLPAKME
jgi:hypothetical protein